MEKNGYRYNSKTGNYERKVTITENGKKKEIVLRAIKMASLS